MFVVYPALSKCVRDSLTLRLPPPHQIPQQVPAIYLSNYSRAIDLADDLSLVRPDQSYRDTYDAQCEELLDNPLAVYMVYTLEQGDDRSTWSTAVGSSLFTDLRVLLHPPPPSARPFDAIANNDVQPQTSFLPPSFPSPPPSLRPVPPVCPLCGLNTNILS